MDSELKNELLGHKFRVDSIGSFVAIQADNFRFILLNDFGQPFLVLGPQAAKVVQRQDFLFLATIKHVSNLRFQIWIGNEPEFGNFEHDKLFIADCLPHPSSTARPRTTFLRKTLYPERMDLPMKQYI